jgi:hypothetical protein
MAQLALFNVYRDRPGDQFGAMTVVTSLKYYYGKAGGVERQEIVAQYWSPTRGFLTSFDIAPGRPVTELSGNRAVHFKAPPGAVLGERLTTACSVAGQDRKNPIRKLSSVSRACAIKREPRWAGQDSATLRCAALGGGRRQREANGSWGSFLPALAG